MLLVMKLRPVLILNPKIVRPPTTDSNFSNRWRPTGQPLCAVLAIEIRCQKVDTFCTHPQWRRRRLRLWPDGNEPITGPHVAWTFFPTALPGSKTETFQIIYYFPCTRSPILSARTSGSGASRCRLYLIYGGGIFPALIPTRTFGISARRDSREMCHSGCFFFSVGYQFRAQKRVLRS